MFTPYLNASNSYIRTARLMIYLKELVRDYRVEVNFTLASNGASNDTGNHKVGSIVH